MKKTKKILLKVIICLVVVSLWNFNANGQKGSTIPQKKQTKPTARQAPRAPDKIANNQPATQTFIVLAKQKWFDTGIDLNQGQKFWVSAQGSWTNGGANPQWVGPSGWSNVLLPKTVAPNLPLSSLVGKIGDTPIFIGENYSGLCPQNGRLYLSINDTENDFDDNEGSVNATVTTVLNIMIKGIKFIPYTLELNGISPNVTYDNSKDAWIQPYKMIGNRITFKYTLTNRGNTKVGRIKADIDGQPLPTTALNGNKIGEMPVGSNPSGEFYTTGLPSGNYKLHITYIDEAVDTTIESTEYHYFVSAPPIIKKLISGGSYISFAKKDGLDGYSSVNGFLHVTHNPGCGISGNSGNDNFFDDSHPLPPLCKVEAKLFNQYWPKNVCGDGSGDLFGTGSYGAKLHGTGYDASYVSWNNTCWGNFSGKNLYYSIGFIISMPEGTNLGEDVFDVDSQDGNWQPTDYLSYNPFPNCSSNPIPHCSILKTAPPYSLSLTYDRNFQGPITYSGILSINTGCNGTLTNITNPNLYPIELVSDGKSFNLGINQSITSAALTSFYGQANINFPVTIRIHPLVNINPSSIASIPVTVTYSYYGD